MDQGELARRIHQLSRLGRQRDFSPARFQQAYPHRSGGSWIASVLDVGYGGVAIKAKSAAGKPAPRWNAEIAQQNDPERHPIRVRAVNSAPLTGGGTRVGCSYD